MKLYPIIILSFLILFSCKKKIDFVETHTLATKKKIKFKLDDETGFTHNSLMFNEVDGIEYLSFLNHTNNSIYVYRTRPIKLLKKISLDFEGVNGVGHLETISSHLFVNKNEIYVYNIGTGVLYLVNEKSNVIKKYNIIDYTQNTEGPFPENTTLQPIKKVGDYLYFSCGLGSRKLKYSTHNSVLRLNTETSQTDYIIPFTVKYDTAFYGSSFKYLPSLTFKNNQAFVSFPIEGNIISYKENSFNTFFTFKASSNYINNIKYYDENIKYGLSENRNYQKEELFSLTTPDYQSIKYDKYRDVFYRIAHIRKTKEDIKFDNKLLFSPDISIIVLDNQFVKISETLFDGSKYHHVMIDVCVDGLAIARRDLYKKNENELTFEVFELLKK